jgi:hypothetical protein
MVLRNAEMGLREFQIVPQKFSRNPIDDPKAATLNMPWVSRPPPPTGIVDPAKAAHEGGGRAKLEKSRREQRSTSAPVI